MDIVYSIERFLLGADVPKAVRTRMARAVNEIKRLRQTNVCEDCDCSRHQPYNELAGGLLHLELATISEWQPIETASEKLQVYTAVSTE